MHLSAEDLLEMIHGETLPEDLEEQLNHMDRCQECADAYAVLVGLRAHREEALQALREAEADEAPNTIAFPTPVPRVSSGWASRGLRLAATLAIAALLAVVIWSSPLMQRDELLSPADLQAALAELTTNEFVETIGRPPSDTMRRVGEDQLLEEARQALLAGQPEQVFELLAGAPEEQPDADYFHFYVGVAHYLWGQPAEAVSVLESLGEDSDSAFLRQACWYRANALLRLGRTDESLDLLDELASSSPDAESRLFEPEAAALAAEVRDLLSQGS
jgi:tetratricopeptide (TPR) repeat protein